MLSALFVWKMSSHAKTKKWTDLGISNFSGKKWPQACQNDLSFFFLTPKQTCIFCETKLRQSARVSNQILVFAFVSGFLVPIRPFFSHRAYALFILHLGSATIRNTDNDWQCQQIEPHKQLLPRLLCTPANKKKLCWHYWSAGVKWKKRKKRKEKCTNQIILLSSGLYLSLGQQHSANISVFGWCISDWLSCSQCSITEHNYLKNPSVSLSQQQEQIWICCLNPVLNKTISKVQ